MKKILFVSPKEKIEMSYPDFLDTTMRIFARRIKVKTVKKLGNGSNFNIVSIDEYIE